LIRTLYDDKITRLASVTRSTSSAYFSAFPARCFDRVLQRYRRDLRIYGLCQVDLQYIGQAKQAAAKHVCHLLANS